MAFIPIRCACSEAARRTAPSNPLKVEPSAGFSVALRSCLAFPATPSHSLQHVVRTPTRTPNPRAHAHAGSPPPPAAHRMGRRQPRRPADRLLPGRPMLRRRRPPAGGRHPQRPHLPHRGHHLDSTRRIRRLAQRPESPARRHPASRRLPPRPDPHRPNHRHDLAAAPNSHERELQGPQRSHPPPRRLNPVHRSGSDRLAGPHRPRLAPAPRRTHGQAARHRPQPERHRC